jgi:hypothetical protein
VPQDDQIEQAEPEEEEEEEEETQQADEPEHLSDLLDLASDIKSLSDLDELARWTTVVIFNAPSGHTEEGLRMGASLTAPVHLADVQEGVRRFWSEYKLAEQRDGRMLCVIGVGDTDPIPIDSRSALAAPTTIGGDLAARIVNTDRPWLDLGLLREAVGRTGLETEALDRGDAGNSFISNLTDFVFNRLLGTAFGPGNGAPDRPMTPQRLLFRVHANSDGLRVHYDPVYLHSGGGTVFGQPTSPVDGELLPGKYIFGVATYGAPRWDPGVYEVPPATEGHVQLDDAHTW